MEKSYKKKFKFLDKKTRLNIMVINFNKINLETII